jgi:hypothetical protein
MTKHTAHACLWMMILACSGCQHALAPYPIGIYCVPQTDLKDAHDAGFNIVTGPASSEYLDAAQRVGLKVLASPNTSAGPDFQADRARQAIARFDRHPALWAWYLIDEPDLNRVSPTEVALAQRFLKNAGARRPTALALYQGGEALNYAHLADITMVDRYPIPWLPLANFPQHVRMARLGLGKGPPLIAVVQAFDWSFYPKERPSDVEMRSPTYQEMRCMTYCALARGATGLFYYCFDDGSWKTGEHPQVWKNLRTLCAEIHQRLSLFQAEHVWWPYVHEFTDSSKAFNSALETSVIPALLRVKHGDARFMSGDYLLAVNNTDRLLTYRITLPDRTRSVTVVGEERTAIIQNGWLEDSFGPFDVHIYGPIQ